MKYNILTETAFFRAAQNGSLEDMTACYGEFIEKVVDVCGCKNGMTTAVASLLFAGIELRAMGKGNRMVEKAVTFIGEMQNVVNRVIAEKSKMVTPDFTKLRKSVAGYLIEETEDAVAGLHNAIKTMDFDEMRKWAHCLKTSWLLYRVSILVDPIMEVARSKDMSAYNRLVSYMAEIDKMATIIITKAKEIRDTRNE